MMVRRFFMPLLIALVSEFVIGFLTDIGAPEIIEHMLRGAVWIALWEYWIRPDLYQKGGK
jgi:hypothetical protein